MRPFKIHIITALLACIIALPLIFCGGLQLFQAYLKFRVEYRMEHETIQSLKFRVQEVQWMEEGREIMVDGQMYDLKSWSIVDGWFLAQGFADHKETKVMQVLNHFSEKEQNRSVLSVLLFGQFFVAVCILSVYYQCWPAKIRNYSPYLLHYIPPFLLRFYPPPRT